MYIYIKEPFIYKPIWKAINRTTKTTTKKLAKCNSHKHYKFYGTNHANTKKIWRTVEDATGHEFDPIGNVI